MMMMPGMGMPPMNNNPWMGPMPGNMGNMMNLGSSNMPPMPPMNMMGGMPPSMPGFPGMPNTGMIPQNQQKVNNTSAHSTAPQGPPLASRSSAPPARR